MMDMVERVARGMYEAEPDAHRFPDWDKLMAGDEMRGRFLRQARASIEAMRESLLMELRKEAHAYGNNDPEKIGFESATAMIDAALSPNQKE